MSQFPRVITWRSPQASCIKGFSESFSKAVIEVTIEEVRTRHAHERYPCVSPILSIRPWGRCGVAPCPVAALGGPCPRCCPRPWLRRCHIHLVYTGCLGGPSHEMARVTPFGSPFGIQPCHHTAAITNTIYIFCLCSSHDYLVFMMCMVCTICIMKL